MKLINYYYSYLTDISNNKPFNFNGLFLKPRITDTKDFIHWDMQNPNDVSYTRFAINNFIDNELYKFSKVTASEFYDRLYRKQSVKVPRKLYINDEDYDKFLNLVQRVETYNYQDVKANMYVFDMGFDSDSDSFYINLDIKLLNPTNPETSEKLYYSEVQDVMLGLNEDDRFIEYIDKLFARLLDEIWSTPTLIDKDNMSIQVYPIFYTDKGQKIRTW
jgi:cytochrome c biogenesis protein ResB